jgi:hypothetical protein
VSDIDTHAPPTRQVIQRSHAKPTNAGAKVTVYCKLPTGLRIRNFVMVEVTEHRLGGGTNTFKQADQRGEDILLWGNIFRIGDPMTHRIVGDYGVTEGVNKESWDNWLEANKDTPMVKNGLVFAAEKRDFGDGEANDRRDTLSGLERMQKDGDPRAPKAVANMSGVKDFEND